MPPSEPIRLQVVIPCHQPLTASEDAMADACKSCYVPLLDALEKAEDLRVSLHFTGHLLDYLARRQEDFLLRLKDLTKRGQVEVLSGLFYGGIPALLPEMDIRGQLEMSGEFWDSYIGQIPTGFWLGELAWTPELPRLFEETYLRYGFIASGQLHMGGGRQRSLGTVERGGQRMAAFVLDSDASQALPTTPVDEWVRMAVERGEKNAHRLLNVWVRAESLGLEPGTHRWCHEEGWLERWFAALSEGAELEPVLAADTYPTINPVEPLRLGNVCAPELQALGDTDAVVDWTDFPFVFPEVDTLYRRMLRISVKLRDAIATMEDEGFEETWSDKLATAQRLVFSAQTSDAYWRGATPGFSDPAIRDAAMSRLERAEGLIDALVQGDEDWIAAEEQDLDGDLSDEVFVSTRHLMAWLVPASGAELRSLDDRASERNILDIGNRRNEPFFSSMQKGGKGADGKTPPKRGEGLKRLEENLPTDVDAVVRRGTRQWVLEDGTSAAEFLSGSAVDLSPTSVEWDVRKNGIDEAGDCNYELALQGELTLAGPKARTLEIHKDISVPIDSPSIQWHNKFNLKGGPAVRWAMELPVRLGLGTSQLTADGERIAPSRASLSGVKLLRVEAQDGSAVEIAFKQPTDVWWTPIRTTLRDLAGFRAADQGMLIVPNILVENEAALVFTLRLQPRSL